MMITPTENILKFWLWIEASVGDYIYTLPLLCLATTLPILGGVYPSTLLYLYILLIRSNVYIAIMMC